MSFHPSEPLQHSRRRGLHRSLCCGGKAVAAQPGPSHRGLPRRVPYFSAGAWARVCRRVCRRVCVGVCVGVWGGVCVGACVRRRVCWLLWEEMRVQRGNCCMDRLPAVAHVFVYVCVCVSGFRVPFFGRRRTRLGATTPTSAGLTCCRMAQTPLTCPFSSGRRYRVQRHTTDLVADRI